MAKLIHIDDRLLERTETETEEHQRKVLEWYNKVAGEHMESDNKIRVKGELK